MAIILELLPSLGDSERLVAATCNEQPVISLVSDNEVPCSPVRVADVVNVTQNSALVSWTYSNRTEIDQFECVFDFNGFPGSYFRTALDQIIELNSSTILPAEARETVENCEAVLLSGDIKHFLAREDVGVSPKTKVAPPTDGRQVAQFARAETSSGDIG